MADIPEAVLAAAVEAVMKSRRLRSQQSAEWATPIVAAALEAAAPLLAEAWGVAERKPGGTRDPRARIACRRCGAAPGQQCVTSSGTRAPVVHAERRNDWRRAGGQTAGLESEGMFMDRFPPLPAPSSPVTPDWPDRGTAENGD